MGYQPRDPRPGKATVTKTQCVECCYFVGNSNYKTGICTKNHVYHVKPKSKACILFGSWDWFLKTARIC